MKISVITINWNNAEGLRKTVESVISQTVPPFEFIIIDGASTDGSVDVIKEHASGITYWVSEKDKGIYNAMNKGVAKATGEWCIFMNSGDCFAGPNVIEKIKDSKADADIICGNTLLSDRPDAPKRHPDSITFEYLFDTAINHQSALIRTSLLRKYPYDEQLKIVSDRKFFLQALILDNCSYQNLDIDIAEYDITGFSSRNRLETRLEYDRVLEELIPERIRKDYGTRQKGALYGDGQFEKMFYDIGTRNFRKPVYKLVNGLLRAVALLSPRARFIRKFPFSGKKSSI